MSLSRLSVQNFRNLESVDFNPSPGINLLFGQNGSGKTSILEAIHLLSTGRSFRSRQAKTLINHDSQEFVVFGSLSLGDSTVPVGVNKNRSGEVIIKIRGQRCRSASELAANFPVRILNSQSYQFLDTSPRHRRSFLDWLLFHVEPDFMPVWRKYEKSIKQRNSLLRHDKIDWLQIGIWEEELSSAGQRLHELRMAHVAQLRTVFDSLLESLDPDYKDIQLRYQAGWDSSISLREQLLEQRGRDQQLGYTCLGPHRADLRLQKGKYSAGDVLSRGQQKQTISALYVAQAQLVAQEANRITTFLVDDLPAELDEGGCERLAGWLSAVSAQVFVTGIERSRLAIAFLRETEKDRFMFHVEQGRVNRYEI